jgi:hypothetical protein
MKRRHSHKNKLAWEKEEVRYFLDYIHVDGDPIDVFKVTGNSYGEWLGINGICPRGPIVVRSGDKQGLRVYGGMTVLEMATHHPHLLEVSQEDISYFKKPEGDWEFRKCKKGDTYRDESGNVRKAYVDFEQKFKGYRWCEPKSFTHNGPESMGRAGTATCFTETGAVRISTWDKLRTKAAEKLEECYAQREEILEAFVAKYGCGPEELEQIEQGDGFSKRWFVQKKEISKIKPPIGLKPTKLWLEERLAENKAAQTRYVCAGKPIPDEWKIEQKIIQVELGRLG